ncbi:MAG: hypothetical protein HFJ47_00050 [Clostridia bacterium]|nr:hypothetical protein [Clostridia bacterium]
MLKIKEYRNVLNEDGKSTRREKIELKELEKYGFTNEQGFLQKDTKCITYYINKDTRIIEIWLNDCYEVILEDTIYDLIQTGLVEKV